MLSEVENAWLLQSDETAVTHVHCRFFPMQGSETCSRESHISCRACFSHSGQLKNGTCCPWRSICLGSYQSRGNFWQPMRLLDVPTCPPHALLQRDSRTVDLLLLREIKICAYKFHLSAAFSSYSSVKYTIRSVTTVSCFPCCCCCTTRRSEACHNLKLPNPHFLYLLSFTSAHIYFKISTFHIIQCGQV